MSAWQCQTVHLSAAHFRTLRSGAIVMEAHINISVPPPGEDDAVFGTDKAVRIADHYDLEPRFEQALLEFLGEQQGIVLFLISGHLKTGVLAAMTGAQGDGS